MEFDHSLWGQVVPDGSRFCHWGGKRLSKRVAKQLGTCENDCVLDVCCGEGGTIDFLQQAKNIVGIDISVEAILRAQTSGSNENAVFVVADAQHLPFPSHTFDKALAQDADAWMHPDKIGLMREIARVIKPGGKFVWQSYTTRKKLCPQITDLLEQVGYSCYDMPEESKIPIMFKEGGFTIESIRSLHSVYTADNMRMLRRARTLCTKSAENLLQLLELEQGLFRKNLWTGTLITARRGSG